MSNQYHVLFNPHDPVEVIKAAIVREVIIDTTIKERVAGVEFISARNHLFTPKTIGDDTKGYTASNSINVNGNDFLKTIATGALFTDSQYTPVEDLPEYVSWNTILNLTNNYSMFATMDTPSIAAVMRMNNELSHFLEMGDIKNSFAIEEVLTDYIGKAERLPDEKLGDYMARMGGLYPSVQRFTRRVMRDAAARMTTRLYHIGSTALTSSDVGYRIATISVPSATAYVVARSVLHSHPACIIYEDIGNKRLWRIASRESTINLPEILQQCIGKLKCSEIFSENGFICMWSDNTNLVATRSDYNLIAN